MRLFRERLSICVCSSSSFGFENGMWDLIVFLIMPFYFFYLISVITWLATYFQLMTITYYLYDFDLSATTIIISRLVINVNS